MPTFTAGPATITKASTTFEDGARVSWARKNLSCTCSRARLCPDHRQMCKHISETLRGQRDHVYFDTADSVLDICVSLPPKAGAPAVWVNVLIGPPDDDGLRSVTWHTQVVGYIREGCSRMYVRSLLWPFMLEFSMNKRCLMCTVPKAVTDAAVPPGLNDQYQIIRQGLYIADHAKSLCEACDDDDLLNF